MATENQNVTRRSRRRRRCDQTRSGQVVILVQIVSWCSVGALLVLRGITTLSNETEESSMDNVTATTFGSRNSSRDDQRISGISDPDEKKGVADGDPFNQENVTAAPNRVHKAPYKINPSSAILITVGTTMLVIGPTVVLARLLDSRRADRDGVKFSKVDLPPSYDEVVDKAPRYSSLFQVTESGELVPISATNITSVPV